MSSFSESEALRLIKDSGMKVEIIASCGHTQRHLRRFPDVALLQLLQQKIYFSHFICREAFCETQQQAAEPDLPLWPTSPIIQL